MKKNLLILVLAFITNFSYAQVINGVINSYAQVTGINNNIVSVVNSAGFTVGEKVMIIKMKGALVDQTNTQSYGDTTAMNEAGKYIFSRIISLTGTTMTLSPFCTSFANTDDLQIVNIPEFLAPTVVGTLTCDPWDGSVGGILAFESLGTLTFNGNINCDGLGYRGGDTFGAGSTCGDSVFFSPLVAFGASGKKGEGIANYVLLQECGRGKLANGGGGAHGSNAGAGGGANAGQGGVGGFESDTCGTVGNQSTGGQSINHTLGHMFMGGGGGAPQNNDNQIVFNGGNGGAIVYIKANQISGNGWSISSNGESTPQVNDEGASGGGAGGSVYIDCPTYVGNLNIDVNGGDGGSILNTINPDICQGTAGAGGGGYVHFSVPSAVAGVNVGFQGGIAGQVFTPGSPCENTSYGSDNGEKGKVAYNFSAPSFTPVPVNLGPDGVICGGTTITLDAGTGFASYLWDNLAPTQTRVINTPGTYFVTVFQNGCTGSDTIVINADTTINANFSYTLGYGCSFDTIYCTNLSTGALFYEWDFGDNFSINNISYLSNPVHYYPNQGSYVVRLIAKVPPCADTIFIPITISHPLNALLSIESDICIGDSVHANGQFLSIPTTNLTYLFEWGDSTSTQSITGDVFHEYTQPGTYNVKLTITDTLGCKSSNTRQVYVAPRNYAFFTVSADSICVGEAVLFRDSLAPNTQRFIWDFNDNNDLVDVHNPSHSFDQAGIYDVTLTGTEIFTFPTPPICPAVTYTKRIVVQDYPIVNLGRDTSICPDITKPILLNNLSNPGGIHQWSNGDVSNSLLITKPGHYWAKDANGTCSTTDSIWVKQDCFLNIPNAFSPTEMGDNAYFLPRNLLSSGLRSFDMKIFNRWGENIFSTTSTTGRGWDGKYNDVLQPLGVYIYMINVEFNNGLKRTFNGNVTLIR